VVTGPADAGKTTVLYSLLREMQAPDLPRRTLFTVEDPVEFQLPGVAQTAVSPRAGLTYEAALHTLLRSDADAVLCAQMRSLRTAELLTELAHTGRLVLTALHVPSAPAVADWMVAVGIERFLSAQVLAGAVSLRLVGGVCLHCREEYRPAADEIRRAGLSPVEDGPFLRGKGCAACGGTGVKGRVPLCEVLEMDAGRRRLLAEGGSGEALWEAAFGPEGGSPALRDDARAQVRAGRITVEAANWALTDYPHPAACGVPTAEMAGGYYPLPSFGEE
jgi:type II secretory ATPase GspE/PulE/Tfp pilus assembly ATPase PilB-like protein